MMGKLWPKWYGHFGTTPWPSDGFHLIIGPCSHGTAYQFRVDLGKYHYFIVYRKKDKFSE